jgi:hypothetical protein
MVNNLVFQEIHLNQGDNQMNNYHLFFDFEINYNHIQNVINVDKEQVEIFEIEHLFQLPVNHEYPQHHRNYHQLIFHFYKNLENFQ